MQARQLRRARGEPQILRQAPPLLTSTGPSYERPYLLRVSSTGPAYERPYLPSTGPGEPQILRHPPLMCSALLMSGTRPMRGDLPYLDRPRLRAVPGLTSYAWYPALLRQTPLCFASTGPGLTSTPPLMCSARGALLCLRAVLCFDRARGASTGPAYLLCALRCSALLRQPLALLRHPPGVLCFACFACVLCLLCFACLLTCLRVSYTY